MKINRLLVSKSPWIIAATYLVLGFVWIRFSDQWVLYVFNEPSVITQVQSIKGWFFISVSAILIFFLIRQSNKMLGDFLNQVRESNKKFEATFNHAPV